MAIMLDRHALLGLGAPGDEEEEEDCGQPVQVFTIEPEGARGVCNCTCASNWRRVWLMSRPPDIACVAITSLIHDVSWLTHG
jgi:hypothetical protein